MLTTLVEKTFIRALRGEITDEEAADQIAGSLCVDSLTNNLQVLDFISLTHFCEVLTYLLLILIICLCYSLYHKACSRKAYIIHLVYTVYRVSEMYSY